MGDVYFRQWLSGAQFAGRDPVATQMVNYAYAIGDATTHEAMLVDPAYDVDELLGLLEADEMTCVGVLATHYHADHVGGSLFGVTIDGIAALLERLDVPVHVQSDEAPWIERTTGRGRRARAPRPGRRRRDRRCRRRAAAHPGAHAGQPVPARRTAGSSLATRSSSTAAAARTCRGRTPPRCTRR